MKRMDQIQTPTAILNPKRAKENIRQMVQKAHSQGLLFRPHFKTHQSLEIGKWFQEFGISKITVSSVDMAVYFSEGGWEDILIAFPVNVREKEKIINLAQRTNLGFLIDNLSTLEIISKWGLSDVDIWIKIDTGMGRAGVFWKNTDMQFLLGEKIMEKSNFHFRGLLTHAGQTYHVESPGEIQHLYDQSVQRIITCQTKLTQLLGTPIETSVGDTPGCWLLDSLGEVNEIRPGNFIFFDAMMYKLGVCKGNEIALCVACPVVGKYEDRQEVVILGGAVHLSKELVERSSPSVYGYAVLTPDCEKWEIRESNFVRALSQEHGVVVLDKETFGKINIGDLLYIIPVHSCLVVDALGYYKTLEGKRISTRIIP